MMNILLLALFPLTFSSAAFSDNATDNNGSGNGLSISEFIRCMGRHFRRNQGDQSK